jgi:hypothetical protein
VPRKPPVHPAALTPRKLPAGADAFVAGESPAASAAPGEPRRRKRASGRLTATIGPELHRFVAERVLETGTNQDAVIVEALSLLRKAQAARKR